MEDKSMEKQPIVGAVLIVGGGIAGPALAIALRRAEINSIVYESNPKPRDEAGAFLNLAPNGLNVLRELGVENRTERLGFRNDRLVFHSDTGRLLADAPVGGTTLMRGALSRVLREAAIDAGVRHHKCILLQACATPEYRSELGR
jgi:FAD-dependent urate hydroxylase